MYFTITEPNNLEIDTKIQLMSVRKYESKSQKCKLILYTKNNDLSRKTLLIIKHINEKEEKITEKKANWSIIFLAVVLFIMQ